MTVQATTKGISSNHPSRQTTAQPSATASFYPPGKRVSGHCHNYYIYVVIIVPERRLILLSLSLNSRHYALVPS